MEAERDDNYYRRGSGGNGEFSYDYVKIEEEEEGEDEHKPMSTDATSGEEEEYIDEAEAERKRDVGMADKRVVGLLKTNTGVCQMMVARANMLRMHNCIPGSFQHFTSEDILVFEANLYPPTITPIIEPPK